MGTEKIKITIEETNEPNETTRLIKNNNINTCNKHSGPCYSSEGERIIHDILINHNITFAREKTFPDLQDQRSLRYDFWLPVYNCAIEYHGEQHYKPTKRFGGQPAFELRKQHDARKSQYCLTSGIHLIILDYTLNNQELIESYLIAEFMRLGICGYDFVFLNNDLNIIPNASLNIRNNTMNIASKYSITTKDMIKLKYQIRKEVLADVRNKIIPQIKDDIIRELRPTPWYSRLLRIFSRSPK